MVGFVEAIEDEKFLDRVRVRALKSREFSQWIFDAGIPLARKIIRVLTDKVGRQGQSKSGNAWQLNTNIFIE